MRTSAPRGLSLFRSEMQARLLALVLLQPERAWTLSELSDALAAPQSSVHREVERAEKSGTVARDSSARPHRFRAAPDDPLYSPLSELLRRTIGVEEDLRAALTRPEIDIAVIHGSWATGTRRPDSDIDVLVIGNADLRELRREVRPIAKRSGRTVDLNVLTAEEFQRLIAERSSFARGVLEGPTVPLVGDLASFADQ